ncbi:MAG: ABC transporter permease [Bdellovibrionaceae bacterium]|nr:ABC transporter permease [Pseudobdellovibrionaceae bacterium]
MKWSHQQQLFVGRVLGWGLIALIAVAVGFDLGDYEIPTALWYVTIGWGLMGAVFAIIAQNLLMYVVKRLIEATVVIWLIASLTFLLLRFIPGGPFDTEKALPPEVKANIEAKYGLNDPIGKQYADFFAKLFEGDLGESYKYIGRSVSDIIGESLPVSAQLGFYSMLLAFVIGIPLGVFAASKHNTWFDTGAMFAAISGVALPSFVVGPLLVMMFSFGVPFTFLYGFLPPALWESSIYYVLPVLTLGMRPAAIIARLTRSSVLEVIQSDFVRTAKAKGVAHMTLLYKHVLKNSLIPVLTISGPLVAGILSGSFVIEIIFAIPGMGKHLVQSVTNRDYPLILGVTLVYSVMLVIANLIVDILYTVVDPRIQLT